MIKKLLILLLLCSPAFGQMKPMMGQQIDWSHPLAKGLVRYWPMLEGTGNITQDLSGNGNVGTVVGTAPSWIAGNYGSAINLPGTDEYISVGTSDMGVVNELTIIVYVTITGAQATNPITQRGDLYSHVWFLYAGNTNLYSWFKTTGKDSNISGGNCLTYGKLHQICLRASTITGNVDLIVDGVIKGTTAGYTGTIISSGELKFGNRGGTVFGYSRLHMVSIYNRALTAGEIAELRSNPFGIIQPTFSVWWYSGIGGEPPATSIPIFMYHYLNH